MVELKNKKHRFMVAVMLLGVILVMVAYFFLILPFDVMPEGSYDEDDGYFVVKMTGDESQSVGANTKFVEGSKSLTFLAAGKDLEQIELVFCGKSNTDVIATALLSERDNAVIPDETKTILCKPTKTTRPQDVYYATIQFVLE